MLASTIAARRPEGHGGTFNLRALVRRRLICLTLLGTLTPHLTYAPWYPRVFPAYLDGFLRARDLVDRVRGTKERWSNGLAP